MRSLIVFRIFASRPPSGGRLAKLNQLKKLMGQLLWHRGIAGGIRTYESQLNYIVKEPKSAPVPFLTLGLKSHSMATDH